MLAAGLDGVPENLAEGGGIGGHVGDDAGGQKRDGLGQLFGHALAGEIEINVVLEDDRDHREVEFGRGADGFYTGEPLQLSRQWVGDLVFDFARAAAHPVGEDDHLVLAEIGNRIHGRAIDNEHTGYRQRRRHQED
jgi:hypothetical protein